MDLPWSSFSSATTRTKHIARHKTSRSSRTYVSILKHLLGFYQACISPHCEPQSNPKLSSIQLTPGPEATNQSCHPPTGVTWTVTVAITLKAVGLHDQQRDHETLPHALIRLRPSDGSVAIPILVDPGSSRPGLKHHLLDPAPEAEDAHPHHAHSDATAVHAASSQARSILTRTRTRRPLPASAAAGEIPSPSPHSFWKEEISSGSSRTPCCPSCTGGARTESCGRRVVPKTTTRSLNVGGPRLATRSPRPGPGATAATPSPTSCPVRRRCTVSTTTIAAALPVIDGRVTREQLWFRFLGRRSKLLVSLRFAVG